VRDGCLNVLEDFPRHERHPVVAKLRHAVGLNGGFVCEVRVDCPLPFEGDQVLGEPGWVVGELVPERHDRHAVRLTLLAPNRIIIKATHRARH
jgi:hypothetical protein